MSSLRTGWGAELLAVFVCGFLLASMLWLGIWFFWTRPTQAAALGAKETALEAKGAALRDRVAAKEQCGQLLQSLQSESKQLDAKLNEALTGWGRCIKSKASPAEENPKPNTP